MINDNYELNCDCPDEGVERKAMGCVGVFTLSCLPLFPQVFLSPFPSLHLALWLVALFIARLPSLPLTTLGLLLLSSHSNVFLSLIFSYYTWSLLHLQLGNNVACGMQCM